MWAFIVLGIILIAATLSGDSIVDDDPWGDQ